jgi:uridylate kinase
LLLPLALSAVRYPDMPLQPKLRYNRVLVKISGEMLRSTEAGDPLDRDRLRLIATQLKAAHDLGVALAVVVGGGNIVRGAQAAQKSAIERVTADHMGMLATVINSLALMDTLEKLGVETRVMSAIPMDRLAEPYILRRATRHLEQRRIIILAAGSGNPYFSTDTAAALRANEIGADILLKATKVDGIYSADPMLDKSATRYDQLTFAQCIEQRLNVLDATAFTLCRENNMPIFVFDLFAEAALPKVLVGEGRGTLVK